MANLFDDKPTQQGPYLNVAPHTISRSGDPATSHLAAEQIANDGTLGRRLQQALDAVTAHPGLTDNELEVTCGGFNGSIRKRNNDLRHLGILRNGPDRKCTVTERMAQTWYVVVTVPTKNGVNVDASDLHDK